MKNSNIFFGESCKAQFANIIYKHLMKREWFTNTDVMVEYLDKKSANELRNYSAVGHGGVSSLK